MLSEMAHPRLPAPQHMSITLGAGTFDRRRASIAASAKQFGLGPGDECTGRDKQLYPHEQSASFIVSLGYINHFAHNDRS